MRHKPVIGERYVYAGDTDAKTWRFPGNDRTEREEPLYAKRIGSPCVLVSANGGGRCPLVIEFDDGFRGIADLAALGKEAT